MILPLCRRSASGCWNSKNCICKQPNPSNGNSLALTCKSCSAGRNKGRRWLWQPNCEYVTELTPQSTKPVEPQHIGIGSELPTRDDWKRQERESIMRALQQAGGKVSGRGGAAELLGMRPTTLSSRLKAMGITRQFGLSQP